VSGGERTLETAEVHGLLQTLTASPKSTWLPAGRFEPSILNFVSAKKRPMNRKKCSGLTAAFLLGNYAAGSAGRCGAGAAVERPDHLTTSIAFLRMRHRLHAVLQIGRLCGGGDESE
jgi:hypothetical protein